MRLFRAAQMREADARAAAAGVPTAELMRAAGEAVARAVLHHFPGVRLVVVLCGRGNNGGDGYVAARRLRAAGAEARLFELEGAGAAANDAAAARSAYLEGGGRAEALNEATAPELLALLAEHARLGKLKAPVVIDALFGSGLGRPLEGWLAELVEGVAPASREARRARVVSIDLPSGLAANAAQPIGPHVHADLTVELAGHKPAALFYPARRAYGLRLLAAIGIPEEVLEGCSDVEVLTAGRVRAALPQRDPAGHKYDAGAVCVVAGSRRYLGAAELACRGAWRAGAGLVTLVAPAQHPSAWPETIYEQHDWSAGGPATWPPPALEPKRAAALVVGPGLEPLALEQLGAILAWAEGPVVLDAAALAPAPLLEALRTVRQGAGAGRGADLPFVLTPHLGEAQRLMAALDDPPGGLLLRDPVAGAAHLAAAYGAVIVLKGPTTVVAAPGGQLAVSTRGSPALASGGTGDVLAGLLGALLAPARGPEALFARVCAGVWLHGVAGELAAAQVGASLVASDVVERLPAAFRLARGPEAESRDEATLGW